GLIGWDFKARAGRKKVTLELGGNAACIVDADQGGRLDHVVERLAFGAYYQSGQSCISVQRILAHADVYDALKEKLVAKISGFVAGDPKDEKTFIGPMIDEDAARRLEGWIGSARKAGAKVLAGGSRKANMLEATLLEDVPRDCELQRQEAFGPVALMERFEDFDAALATINDSDFGLQAGVFTDSLSHAMRAWDRLEAGGEVGLLVSRSWAASAAPARGGAAEQLALAGTAAQLQQGVALGLGLDTLAHRVHAQAPRQRQDRAHQGQALLASTLAIQAGDEA